jgi:head-tail adaptor
MTTLYLSDAQLTIMRGQVARTLPGTAIIQSVVNASDGMGGWSETWTAVTGGTVSCRIDPLSASMSASNNMLAGAEGFKLAYQLTVPYNAPLSVGNRVNVGGTVYEVRELANTHSWNVSIRAMLARVE